MMIFIKRVFALIGAAVFAGAGGSIASTYNTIINLRQIGAPIADGTAFKTAIYDLKHFAPLYIVFVLIAFLIAFLVSGGIYKAAKFGRPIIYMAAGAFAVWLMLYLMQALFFGVPLVAGARDTSGLIFQILMGGLGGLLFSFMTRPKTASL